ncbi:hypothetical protein [Kitasatospora sp. LaBMicrA B282]|uniref:hypothetical protein n=1 Tax=Kitasatospora sp. LaBMicrA B282 TaxID=3420949 RepID=UPI003D0B2781
MNTDPGPAVHLSAIAVELGARVPIADLDDPSVTAEVANLHAGGLRYCRVAEQDVVELAATAARRTLAAAGAPAVDAVVHATDSPYRETATKDGWAVLSGAGVPTAPTVAVGGSASANLAAALRVATGLLVAERLDTVLLVSADRITDGARYQPVGVTVLSDGAAACLISRTPHGPGYRVLGVSTAIQADAVEVSNSLKAANLVKLGVTAARERLLADLPEPERGFRHLVTGHYSLATRTFLSRLCGLDLTAVHTPAVAEVGHSFSADLLLSLASLHEQGLVEPGDRVLVLATSPRSWSLIALEFTTGPAGADPAEDTAGHAAG